MAHAQTNIDQGKTPAQIFANDCAACHKAHACPGERQERCALTEFLREHYTTSREQAAALAAYVLGAGFGATPANEPPKSTKAEEETPAAAKQQKPTEEAATPEDEPTAAEDPNSIAPRTPASGQGETTAGRPNTTATRDRRRGGRTRARGTCRGRDPARGAGFDERSAAKRYAEPGEPAAVPRDDIPD